MVNQIRPPPTATAPKTTEIVDARPFYFAENHHHQYLAKSRTATPAPAARPEGVKKA